ncbi:hypothetical protein QVD17_28422 [Tagetes erecta]|uniref:TIR domain-containing protein n=1 Tax=Tagetes erecta TaxID=13708 RepID=A0AAD8KCT3_TARER|nr:hypothetical protein QVD17_28422 [Tagetes erecta]
MSSSSSSSHLIPVPSRSWNYDVFLSFRGEDTRKNFVDHLYTALVQQGIHTYKDDKTLDRGESTGPSLLKAIQESRIAVIVFSKNYADSSWCLEELTYIIDCMDKRGQIVLPIFYDIDPSNVRKQNGEYGESFAKHELENKQRVELWKKALVKAGNLSGWVPKDFANGHEAKCIKDIIGVISSKLSLVPITNINKGLIGIETRLQDLKSKMEIRPGGVRMVGIWGVGGGGKTTLAHAAYSEISDKFDATCFLENIRDESSKHGIKKLQESFLSIILKKEVKLESEIEGKSMIKRRLSHKSVLVVLDDVDDLKQLEVLAGSHDWFGEGSLIIITTRDEHLLTRQADTIYEVSLLSHDEAMKLFNTHAYREEKPIEDYEKLSLEVVSYAGGLPLALEVLGSFLYDKNKVEWMGVLAKLKEIPYPKVIERLKISYDGLEQDQKELFLDIACFLRRWDKKEAMLVLDACSFHPRIGVKVLIQKSLIKVVYRRFDMHDLVEEMARYIVKEEQPKRHSRIWKEQDMIDLCDMGATSSLMEIEVLHLLSSERHSRLPKTVANMKKLRWMTLKGYKTSSFLSNVQPINLGCLFLTDCKQNQLWKGCKLFPNLKILDIRELESSNYLTRTPNFNGLPCLERLILINCGKLKEIHPSVGHHESLVSLKIEGCHKLKTFPPIIRMKKLKTLIIASCYRFRKFPLIQTNMDGLECLVLDSTSIEVIPPIVGELCSNLVTLSLSKCFRLKRIEGNFRLLKRLKYVNLDECPELERVAWDFFTRSRVLNYLVDHIGLPPFEEVAP